MKSTILTIIGFTSLLASAAPADDIRKRDVVRRQMKPSSFFPSATVLASSSAYGSVYASSSGAPTALASSWYPSGSAVSYSSFYGTGYSSFYGTGYYPSSSSYYSGSYYPSSSSGASFASVSSGASATASYSDYISASSTAGASVAASSAPPRLAVRSCEEHGKLVCNGEKEFGVCNFGSVNFAPVGHGTSCVDGKIKFDLH